MKCRYLDEEGDLCTLNRLTLPDWTQQHSRGPLKIHVSLWRAASRVRMCRMTRCIGTEASNMGTMISCIDHHGGLVQNVVLEYESPKFETAEVKDTADHVDKEAARYGVKTEVVDWIQIAPGSSTQAENITHFINAARATGSMRGGVRSCRCSPRQICTRPRIREP